MDEIQIKLAGIWIALMLTYLLGDVLRLCSGDFVPGEMQGQKITKGMWFGIAVLMVIPICMVVLTLMVDSHSANRWANLIVAAFFFVFNLIGLPTYQSAYDQFLIVVGLGFNVLTVWTAWNW